MTELGLATKMRGRLVTFDGGIPLEAVIGASRTVLEVIAPAEASWQADRGRGRSKLIHTVIL